MLSKVMKLGLFLSLRSIVLNKYKPFLYEKEPFLYAVGSKFASLEIQLPHREGTLDGLGVARCSKCVAKNRVATPLNKLEIKWIERLV